MTDWLPVTELGVVERVDDEWIATEFYTVGVPVWPRGSRYRTRGRDGDERSVPIAHHAASIALGYARRPVWLAAIVLAAPSFAEPARWGALLALAVPVGVLATILTFVVGRVSSAERDRRRLLRRVVGLGAPPELLSVELAARVRTELEAAWGAISPTPWPQAITDGVASELLVVLADYNGRHALAERALANLESRRHARS